MFTVGSVGPWTDERVWANLWQTKRGVFWASMGGPVLASEKDMQMRDLNFKKNGTSTRT